MVKQERTMARDLLPSILQRACGKQLYCIDLDSLQYTWKDGDVEFACLIDYKYGPAMKDRKVTHQTDIVQKKLANKLGIPFFVVHSYLDTNLPVKMMFVLPVNKIAKYMFARIGLTTHGKWLSLRNWSRFLHYLRKMPNDLEAQKNLSNEYYEYNLPGEDE